MVMAMIFMAVVLRGGSPVEVDDYGPIVFAVPAWVWAGLQIVFSATASWAAFTMRAQLMTIASVCLACKFLFFGSAAAVAGASGTLVVAMSLPTAALCFLIGWVGADHGGR